MCLRSLGQQINEQIDILNLPQLYISQIEIEMNKPKTKLKTMPNQLTTKNEEFLFQSQTEENMSVRRINLASPTFATEIGSIQDNQLFSGSNKENKINSSLKDLTINNNDLRTVNEPRIIFQSYTKTDYEFLKGQNEKLVEKCKLLDFNKRRIEEENKILNDKLSICKSCLEQKKFKNMEKFLHMQNSSSQLTNIDLYLQMQAFKQDYKYCKDINIHLQSQNKLLNLKIKQLQQIIQNYTEKSQKGKQGQQEKQGEDRKKQKIYLQKIEQLQKMHEQKQREIINECKQKQKIIKRIKDQYQKLKFLKQQIEKKRQQDIKNKFQLENLIKEADHNLSIVRQQLIRSQQENERMNIRLKEFQQSSQNIQNERQILTKELQRIQKTTKSLQDQNRQYKISLQNFQNLNRQYEAQITLLSEQKTKMLQNIEHFQSQKNKYEILIASLKQNEERQGKRISQLEQKFNQTENQLQKVKLQFEKYIQKFTNKELPQVNSFKEEDNQQKEIEKQQRYEKIVESLQTEIQQLRKQKQNLKIDLQTERQKLKYQMTCVQLQDRKFQQLEYSWNPKNEGQKEQFRGYKQLREKNRISKKFQVYGSTTTEFSRSTKASPQLKMIRQLLLTILNKGKKEGVKLLGKQILNRQKQKESIQKMIEEIKKMAQETADLFDQRNKQRQILEQRIKNKQEVIKKLLRFTPQQKKACILEFLNTMENIDEYTVQQVYKTTKMLEEEAIDWKQSLNNLIELVDKYEQQIIILEKQLTKYNSSEPIIKYKNYCVERIQNKKQKNDKIQRFNQRIQLRKY